VGVEALCRDYLLPCCSECFKYIHSMLDWAVLARAMPLDYCCVGLEGLAVGFSCA
jgi:hypothetical protein